MKSTNVLMVFALAGALSACSITTPVTVTSNPIGSKMGKSSGKCYLGICVGVDASVLTAAQNGEIKEVSTVDFKRTNFLGIVQSYECTVTGE